MLSPRGLLATIPKVYSIFCDTARLGEESYFPIDWWWQMAGSQEGEGPGRHHYILSQGASKNGKSDV